jgi:competence protein ComEC
VIFEGRIYPLRGSGSIGSFDYRRYLHLKGIFGIVYLPSLLTVQVESRDQTGYFALVDNVRSMILGSFSRNLSQESATLAGGFLIGETRNISTELYRRFRDSGTLHVLAVSGSNVALVLLVALAALRPFPFSRTRRAVILLGIIILFNGLSYGEPSVLRASVMASLVILAGIAGRKVNLNQVIALTAAIILVFDPAQLFDIGFQLSFVTAWGLIFFVPKVGTLMSGWYRRVWYRWLVFPILISVVAQICSAPLIALYFGKVPLAGVPANLLIVPLVSVVVIGSLILLLANLVLPVLAFWFGSFLDLLVRWVVYLLGVFGSETLPQLEIGHWLHEFPGMLCVPLVYVFIVLISLSIGKQVARRVLVIGSAVAANLILGSLVLQSWSSERVEVHLSTVPGGVAAVVDYSGRTSADLIITSAAERKFSLEERVFSPMLQLLDVDSLRLVVILSSAYGAIDDLLALSERYHARAIYIPE